MCKDKELEELDRLRHIENVISCYNDEIVRILDYMKELQSEGKENTTEFKELEIKVQSYIKARDTLV